MFKYIIYMEKIISGACHFNNLFSEINCFLKKYGVLKLIPCKHCSNFIVQINRWGKQISF